MRLARSCLSEDLAAFPSLIVELQGVAAFGLGPNKECYELAASVAHAITVNDSLLKQPVDISALPCLEPDPDRYDLTSEKEPAGNWPQFACVWRKPSGMKG